MALGKGLAVSNKPAVANPAIALAVESARSRCRLSGLQFMRLVRRAAELGSFGDTILAP